MDGWRARLMLVAIASLAVGCSTVKYSADYDPQVSFSGYKTYDWILPSEDEQAALERINPFLERRLQRSVEAELTQRGFGLQPGAPDLLVSVYPVVPPRGADSRGRAGWGGARGAYRSPVHVSVGFGFGYGRPYRYGYRYPYFGYRSPFWGYPYWGYPYGWGFAYPHFAVAFPVYPSYGWGGGYSSGVALDGLAPGTLVIDVVDVQADELIWRGWAEGAFYDMPRPEQLDEYIAQVVGKMMKDFPPPDEQR